MHNPWHNYCRCKIIVLYLLHCTLFNWMKHQLIHTYIFFHTRCSDSYLVAFAANNERARGKSKTMGSREQGWDVVAERRIKVSGNVIYGIDLNPAFKPRAIIQSRSSFLFPLPFLRNSPFSPSSDFVSRSPVYYPSRARSIFDIYLRSYFRSNRSHIIYTRYRVPRWLP